MGGGKLQFVRAIAPGLADHGQGIFSKDPADSLFILRIRQVADGVHTGFFQQRHGFLSDSHHIADVQGPELGRDLGFAQHSDAHGFAHVAGHFRQKAVGSHADGTLQPQFLIDRCLDCHRQVQRPLVPADRVGHIEKTLIDGNRFEHGRKPPEDPEKLSGEPTVIGMVSRNNDQVRIQLPGLEHRHGGMDAQGPGSVIGCGQHASGRQRAHCHGPVFVLRMTQFFSTREECIQVNVKQDSGHPEPPSEVPAFHPRPVRWRDHGP